MVICVSSGFSDISIMSQTVLKVCSQKSQKSQTFLIIFIQTTLFMLYHNLMNHLHIYLSVENVVKILFLLPYEAITFRSS